MAKYLLSPTRIEPQVSLFQALYWIAFGYFPKSFHDIEDHMEIWARFCIDPAHYDFVSYDLLERFNIPSDHLLLNSRKQFFPSDYCYEQMDKFTKNALCTLYSLFKNKKIRMYATEITGMFSSEAFLEVSPDNVNFTDIKLFNKGEPIIKSGEKTFYNILVSTDDLFKEFPLKYSSSNKVKFAADHYFVDDDNNKEVSLNNPGRKPLFTQEQIIEILKFAESFITNDPKALDQTVIHSSIDWAKENFAIKAGFTTMKDYLSPVIKKRK